MAADALLVIIPCLNEEFFLEKLVNDLLSSSLPLATIIAIVDGGSTDNTSVIAKKLAHLHPEVRYLYNPEKLQSAAINLAVSAFGQDTTFLIRIDAHAQYPRNYCKDLIDEAIRTGADSVVVTMKTVGISTFQRAVAAAQNSKLGNGGSAHRSYPGKGKWVDHGHHALMKTSAFVDLGGYDASFSHNEDAELDYRLIKAGYRIWLTADTSITYYPRSTIFSLFLQYYKYGVGRARNIQKNRIKLKLRQVLPVLIVPTLFLLLFAWISALVVLPAALWIGTCLLYGFSITHPKNLALGLMIGLSAMVMHIAWSAGFWSSYLTSTRKYAL